MVDRFFFKTLLNKIKISILDCLYLFNNNFGAKISLLDENDNVIFSKKVRIVDNSFCIKGYFKYKHSIITKIKLETTFFSTLIRKLNKPLHMYKNDFLDLKYEITPITKDLILDSEDIEIK